MSRGGIVSRRLPLFCAAARSATFTQAAQFLFSRCSLYAIVLNQLPILINEDQTAQTHQQPIDCIVHANRSDTIYRVTASAQLDFLIPNAVSRQVNIPGFCDTAYSVTAIPQKVTSFRNPLLIPETLVQRIIHRYRIRCLF